MLRRRKVVVMAEVEEKEGGHSRQFDLCVQG
jgi:hypothetical protein